MKLFIYEHITSGALLGEDLPTSLAREGNDMLQAIVQDFSQIAEIELCILRDHRLEILPDHSQLIVHTINDIHSFQHHYQTVLKSVDYVLVIAPETDQVLTSIQQDVIDSPARLLGCTPTTTDYCTHKQGYVQLLGNLVPRSAIASDWLSSPFESSTGYILKPNDGAGCIDTLFFPNSLSLSAYLQSLDTLNKLIVQKYIEGENLSISLLADPSGTYILSINQQQIQQRDGVFSFHGCDVNAVDAELFNLKQAQQLADTIFHMIPNLFGFIGIDFIINKQHITVIDINPRLTTSYVGLHNSINANPAQLLLTMIKQGIQALPPLSFRHNAEALL